GMANLLARPKALLAGRRLNRHLGQGKFLSPRGEELGDILDRVVSLAGISRSTPGGNLLAIARNALVFILISVVCGFFVAAPVWLRVWRGRPRARTLPSRSRSAQLFQQLLWNLLEKSRGHTGLRHIGAVASPVYRAAQDQRIHRPRHADIAEPAFLLDVVGL